MAATKLEDLMQSDVTAILTAAGFDTDDFNCYLYEWPTASEKKLVAAVVPISPGQSTPLAKMSVSVQVAAADITVARSAADAIHLALREKTYSAPQTNTPTKVYCASLGRYTYLGRGVQGEHVFSETFQLTTVY